ncbi:MAG: YqgE/AlgH family protein [SAR324 cluster bacterium]|nr:YqgE/AlgH family protein [SAR324 cluster bacterium]
MKTPNNKQEKVSLLVSMPSLKGDIFNQTVILLIDNSVIQDVVLGIVLNKPARFEKDDELIQSLSMHDMANAEITDIKGETHLLWGGPVATSSMWYLREDSSFCQQTNKTIHKLDFSFIKNESIEFNDLAPLKIHEMGLGYACWSEEQLDDEIGQSSWWRVELSYQDFAKGLLAEGYQNRWRFALNQVGVKTENFYDHCVLAIQ